MNGVVAALLKIVERDPLPAGHASSHWQRYGAETVVTGGDALGLEAAGFSSSCRSGLPSRLLGRLERLSYAGVTGPLRSYPSISRAAGTLSRELSRGLPRATPLKRWFWAVRPSHERIFATALSVLADHFEECGLRPRTFAVIGDGDGFLGALCRRTFPGSTIYCIDLPKMLVFQAQTHQKAVPGTAMSLLGADGAGRGDVVFVLPQDVEQISERIDCALNVSSMQEMNQLSIARYFSVLRGRSGPQSRFYCVNQQRKELIGGEVTTFAEYPWHAEDEIFLDGPCPYFTHYLAPFTLSCGPRVFNRRVPCINYVSGVVWHRLVRLAPLAGARDVGER